MWYKIVFQQNNRNELYSYTVTGYSVWGMYDMWNIILLNKNVVQQ